MTIRPEPLVLRLSDHLGEPASPTELNRWAMAIAAIGSETTARFKALAPHRPAPREVPFGLVEQWTMTVDYSTGDVVLTVCVPEDMTPEQLTEAMLQQLRERLFKMAADDSVTLLGLRCASLLGTGEGMSRDESVPMRTVSPEQIRAAKAGAAAEDEARLVEELRQGIVAEMGAEPVNQERVKAAVSRAIDVIEARRLQGLIKVEVDGDEVKLTFPPPRRPPGPTYR